MSVRAPPTCFDSDTHLQQLTLFIEKMLSTRALGLAPSLRKAATSSNFGMRSNDLASVLK